MQYAPASRQFSLGIACPEWSPFLAERFVGCSCVNRPDGKWPSAADEIPQETGLEVMNAASDDLRRMDALLTSINRSLDAMYVKLRKIVAAAETANEALNELPSPEQLERLLAASRRSLHGDGGPETSSGNHAGS